MSSLFKGPSSVDGARTPAAAALLLSLGQKALKRLEPSREG
uniref:Uncharacterized protein n=1 Tax=Anguilla anguilla TaxID=7936 RepID=A0A0E9W4S2_ANGAN